jgi:CBS domain-containing protein
MNRPVHVVKPQTPLANIMEYMCRYDVMCLPVVDQQGKFQGIVTETDIFKVLLDQKSGPGISASGNEHEEQSTSDHFSDHVEIESAPTM